MVVAPVEPVIFEGGDAIETFALRRPRHGAALKVPLAGGRSVEQEPGFGSHWGRGVRSRGLSCSRWRGAGSRRRRGGRYCRPGGLRWALRVCLDLDAAHAVGVVLALQEEL